MEGEIVLKYIQVELIEDPAPDEPVSEAYKEHLQRVANYIIRYVDEEWLEERWTPSIQKCLRKAIPKWQNKWDAIELAHKRLTQLVSIDGSKILTELRKHGYLEAVLVQGEEVLDEYFFTPHQTATALLALLHSRNIITIRHVSKVVLRGDLLETKKAISVIRGPI
ncbi:MAG: hypothetical protein GXO10_04950 [Crenarchaeota archaeon]|nr:hypothetical protein [Thermoproteota archaeon]